MLLILQNHQELLPKGASIGGMSFSGSLMIPIPIIDFPIINKSEISVRAAEILEICPEFIANLFIYSDTLNMH